MDLQSAGLLNIVLVGLAGLALALYWTTRLFRVVERRWPEKPERAVLAAIPAFFGLWLGGWIVVTALALVVWLKNRVLAR